MSDLELAFSESKTRELIKVLMDGFKGKIHEKLDTGSYIFEIYLVCHLEGGKIDFLPDNTIKVSELDIKWEKLLIFIGIELHDVICTPPTCLFWEPVKGCRFEVKYCYFQGTPDIWVPINLNGQVTSEVSFILKPSIKYRVDPNRPPKMDYIEAQEKGIPNKWQVFLDLDPATIQLDLVDIADSAADLLMKKAKEAIEAIFPGPGFLGWVKDVILSQLPAIDKLIRDALDLPDDIHEWFFYRLENLEIRKRIVDAFVVYFGEFKPLYELEDPYEVLPGEQKSNKPGEYNLIPVKLPIETLKVRVDASEMILEANVGAV